MNERLVELATRFWEQAPGPDNRDMVTLFRALVDHDAAGLIKLLQDNDVDADEHVKAYVDSIDGGNRTRR